MASDMKTSIFLLCLFLVTKGINSEKENSISKEKSEVDQLQPEPSKISELYIGDLLRTNNKDILETASTNHYQVSTPPTHIDAEINSGHRMIPKSYAEHPRHELLPPLALNGQVGVIKQTMRPDGTPVNLFEKFLVKQADLLEQNVLASERSAPAPARRYAHSNGPVHQRKADCDKHPHHAASTDDGEYTRHSSRPHHTRDRTAAISDHDISSRHRPLAYTQSSEHYSSHSDPVYSKSRTHASEHDSDSDSNSKTVGSKSFSKSFSSSKTTTPNRVRQKAVIIRDQEPPQQKYSTPYDSENRGHSGAVAYHDNPSNGPSSYEVDSPGQYESYTPASERGHYYQDYSPQAHSKAPPQEHIRPPVTPKKMRAYKPESPPAPHYRQQHSYNGNHPTPCKDKYNCPSEYSEPQEYHPGYTQEKPKTNYERPTSIAPHKVQKYRETVKPHQAHYRAEEGNRHLNYEPYQSEVIQPPPHSYPVDGYERNHHARKSAGGKRRDYTYRPVDNPQERHVVVPEEHPRYPEQTRGRSNYEQKPNVDRISQTQEPLEQYDSHIVTNREVKPQISMSVSYSNSGDIQPRKRVIPDEKTARSTRRTTSEVPSVEESRIDSQQPQAAQSSTSKSVSFSESRSFNADGRVPLHPERTLKQQQARTYDEPQKMTNPLASESGDAQLRNPQYQKVYKPFNSEYPASYANEQRHNPLHSTEENIGRKSHVRGREPRGDHSDSYEEDEGSPIVKTKSTHDYKSDITGYKDEYSSHEPLELDDAFFQKYGISKSAKIIVATAEKPNLFVADGTHLKEGQSNSDMEDRPYGSEEHGPYQHNSGEEHGHNSGAPYEHNSGAPYEHNSGTPHSSEAPYGYHSEEEGSLKGDTMSYRKPEEINPFRQLPDSFDSLVHSNPTFLRNLDSLPNKFQNGHDLALGGLMLRSNSGDSKSFVNSNGQTELVQKHGDGVSRIIFNRQKDNEQFDESKKIESYQPQPQDKRGQMEAQKSEKVETVVKLEDVKKTA